MYKRHLAGNVHSGGTTPENNASQLRISVAMATYNGEKYIEEQLLSICRQTRKPDEIVISDDGSRDATLEVVARVAASEDAQGIDFVVITDNPRHGYCGNFEWAIQHTTGDLIFLSDQDDVWLPEKVAEIVRVFEMNSDAECVCHNATLIGKNGNTIEGVFDERFLTGKLNIPEGSVAKIDRETYLEPSVSWGGIHGMSMCCTRAFIKTILPFPKCRGFHDKWITVCAIMKDGMYYLNLPLILYRLHATNTCGSSAYRGNLVERIKRSFGRLLDGKGCIDTYYRIGTAIKMRLEKSGYANHLAYGTAKRLVEIGEKTYDAETSGRIMGAVKLCKLFCTDMRYRRCGMGAFLQELVYILRYSKSSRLQNAGEINK